MAIQNRRGSYTNFDPDKMVAGEFAIVQDGDSASSSGRSLYICFEPGVVKRICDYEDIQDEIEEAAEQYIGDISTVVTNAENATTSANNAAASANEAAEEARQVAKGTNVAFGQGYGTCTSSASSYSKLVTMADYELVTGGIVVIRFSSAVPSNSTLNINGCGEKYIFYSTNSSGAPITIVAGVINAGDTAAFIYDGTYYRLLSVYRDKMTQAQVDTGTSTIPMSVSPKVIRDSIDAGAEPVDMSGSITLTASTNCNTVTLNSAYRIGRVLFIKYTVKPVSGLAVGANVIVNYSGFTPLIVADWRMLNGIIGTSVAVSWISNTTEIGCRLLSSSAWSSSSSCVFAGIVPLDM